jgi:hypothetical protein
MLILEKAYQSFDGLHGEFFLFSFDDDGIGVHGELETLAGRSISINILES